LRLPFSEKSCCDGDSVCSQALMALADGTMVIAVRRPGTAIVQ
jgi:hypothetical protein